MTFTLPNAYHSVWVVFQVACLLSPVSCLCGNIYLSVSVYIVNVILYFKYKFGLYIFAKCLIGNQIDQVNGASEKFYMVLIILQFGPI